MTSLNRFLWAAGFCLLAAALCAFAVSNLLRPAPKAPVMQVTARTVVDRITSRYFVVTKSAYMTQETQIKVDQGSRWSNLLWGQTLTARGVIRVDLGIDLSGLTVKDVVVDAASKTVKIDIPAASIMGAAPFGDVEVKSDQGVLKFLLDNDPNSDQNRARDQLVADAKAAARQDNRLFTEARRDAIKLLQIIVEGTGYQLVVPAADQADATKQ
jgi:hypothetical protein